MSLPKTILRWSTLSLLCAMTLGSPLYDFVIAGGGTSGLLLAIALTQNPNVTVAVLEAGMDGRTDARITDPSQEGAIENTVYDWQFTSVPQSGLMNDANVTLNRGKVIGGTSAMNYMLWNTASKIEWNAWQNVLGNQGWNWTSIDADVKSAEHFLAPVNKSTVATYTLADHGTAGPIQTTMQRMSYSLYGQYLEPSLRSLGVTIQVDKCGGSTTGAAPIPLSIYRDQFTRCYSGSAYTTVQSRSNLHLYINTTAAGIVWQTTAAGQPLVASGMQYYNDTRGVKVLSTINAKQVILSAGPLQTPQLLELSGIGDPSILAPLGIKTKINNTAVGMQLQDKLAFGGGFSFNISNFTGYGGVQTFLDYAQPSRFLSTSDQSTLKQMLSDAKPSSTVTNATLSMLRYLVQNDQPLVEYGWYGPFINTYLLHPLSSGSVHIKSSNALVPGNMNPGYNSAVVDNVSIDLWVLSKAISYLTNTLAKASPFNSIDAAFSVLNTMSASQIQNTVYKGLGQGQHLTGGAVMLPKNSGGVVDTNLLVYGTSNVRVVDSSVFPTEPGHHPMSLAYAVAMRAASILS